MAVCGDPESRHGIILAKNELAKGYGVQTAETIRDALRKCPQLTLVRPHHKDYAHWSRIVNGIYQRYTDLVEPFGIDESWLDVTASQTLFGDGQTIADGQKLPRSQRQLADGVDAQCGQRQPGGAAHEQKRVQGGADLGLCQRPGREPGGLHL